MLSKRKVLLISCCYNEADNLSLLYREISRVLDSNDSVDWSLLLVDDGSEDQTAGVVHKMMEENHNIDYLRLSRNYGKEAAISAGLDYVATIGVDAAILLDADLQHPVDVLPEMINHWLDGLDMVVAVPHARRYGRLNKILSAAFHRFIAWTSKSEVVDGAGDFRLIGIDLIKKIVLLREKERYMKGLYGFAGGRVGTVIYQEDARLAGETSFGLLKRLKLAVSAIVSLTTLPIRFFTLLGFFTLFCAFLYLVYILFGILIDGKEVPGFASLLFSIVILNGLIMVQIGIQGEYISQLLKEVKNRPLYTIDEQSSSVGFDEQ